jgi:SSS family solute:Na+ symporter
MSLSSFDLAIIVVYLLVVTGVGAYFFRRRASAERFMAAGRSLPGWAIGLSIFGSYISSISFVANPGSAYKANWNGFVFSLATIPAALIAVRWFVPFYRQQGSVSAYEHFEQRFGPWARTYAVVCFLLTQVARTGTILYLLALTLAPLVNLHVAWVIVIIGCVMTIYPMLGGAEAAVWSGVAQSAVLIGGVAVCLGLLVSQMPGGWAHVSQVTAAKDGWSLGSLGSELDISTFWVVLAYGLVMNLQNFGADQSFVQRFITASDDREAKRSVLLGAVLYVPLAAVFFLIGTLLYAFYQAQPDRLAAAGEIGPDAVFPWFIATELPSGVRGLLVASLCAAAMDSTVSYSATLFLCDVYRRYLRPDAGEREAILVLRTSTIVFGLLGIGAGVAMIRVEEALQEWWRWAGIFSGGVLGLFVLGCTKRVTSRGALVATLCGLVVIAWITLAPQWADANSSPATRLHPFLAPVFGTLTVLVVGGLTSLRRGR